MVKSQEGKGACATYELLNKNFSIPVDKIHTNDTNEDTRISIFHENGSTLHIILNLEKQPRVFIENDRVAKKTKAFFRECFPEMVVVVPTLSQFEEFEKSNDPKYVEGVEHTRLAARNFRNIWRLKSNKEFLEFSELVEDNWKGVTINSPYLSFGIPTTIEMKYEEDGHAREIALSGFGFQAWLQIMTHFLRGTGNDILVLDEPDVYLPLIFSDDSIV